MNKEIRNEKYTRTEADKIYVFVPDIGRNKTCSYKEYHPITSPSTSATRSAAIRLYDTVVLTYSTRNEYKILLKGATDELGSNWAIEGIRRRKYSIIWDYA